VTAIRWTETAVADLAGIKEYISLDSALLAHTVVTRVYNAVSQLEARRNRLPSTRTTAQRIMPARSARELGR
jgi:hypothetical protein